MTWTEEVAHACEGGTLATTDAVAVARAALERALGAGLAEARSECAERSLAALVLAVDAELVAEIAATGYSIDAVRWTILIQWGKIVRLAREVRG